MSSNYNDMLNRQQYCCHSIHSCSCNWECYF